MQQSIQLRPTRSRRREENACVSPAQPHGAKLDEPFALTPGVLLQEGRVVERPQDRLPLGDREREDASGDEDGPSRREVSLTRAALGYLDAIPAPIPHVFPNANGGLLNLNGFRRREWGPGVIAAGVAKPARLYDLWSTFASTALARGVTVYELARIMGTNVTMIEAHYGALLDTAHHAILDRLEGGDSPPSSIVEIASGSERGDT